MPVETRDEFYARQQEATGEGPVQLHRGVSLWPNGAVLDASMIDYGNPVAKQDAPPEGHPERLRAAVHYWKRRVAVSHQTFVQLKTFLNGRSGAWQGPKWESTVWGQRPREPVDCLRALAKIARSDKRRLAEAEQAVKAADLPKVLLPGELQQARAEHLERERAEQRRLLDEANAELDKIVI